ncbi:MAG TPA: alpha-amylase family glycosyl hydrolase, partial [Ignavibacteriaceae bacterium]|nr:alpha-amylase family glycosyl hydrolase [Ignavibacteriaceae bacterium]
MYVRKYYFFIYSILLFLFIISTNSFAQKETTVVHPEWSKNATIYEVNVRQYTPEGTFNAFAKHLPELKKMGVKILWIMPINPIGIENRKGTLGSYYSVRDYKAINPEFGTLQDFKNLVDKIHKMGMHVIIDWVANHTSWDNKLTKTNPDFYKHDSLGNFVAPVKDWSDVIALNYNNPKLWDYMEGAMEYWVKNCNIDGFRCDVASMVPVPFWNFARKELDKIKPVFMLAESENPDLHEHAFDMTYSWEYFSIIKNIAKDKMNVKDLDAYFKKDNEQFNPDAYRMVFTTNHDENSWNGSLEETFGAAE